MRLPITQFLVEVTQPDGATRPLGLVHAEHAAISIVAHLTPLASKGLLATVAPDERIGYRALPVAIVEVPFPSVAAAIAAGIAVDDAMIADAFTEEAVAGRTTPISKESAGDGEVA